MFTARAMRPLAITIGLAAFLGADACGGDTAAQPKNDVASVQIIVAPTNPRVGETTLVSATPVNAGGVRVPGVACVYASSAPGVAAVVPSGADAIVTGLSVGTTTILATCGNSNNSVLITVRPPLVKLTLTKLGSAPGGLFANPAGLSYDLGTVVTVTASSVAGSVFTGWGGACAGVGACVVTMTADLTVTGTFETPFVLTITLAGAGAGVVTADPPGLSYAPNRLVTLTAVASATSVFKGWGGACAGTGTCPLIMDANKAVTATFEALPPGKIIGLAGNLAFGNVNIGQRASTVMTVTNGGASPLTITGMTGPAGGVYTASWTNGVIPAGGSQLVTVYFTPTAAQSYVGTLTVNGDQTGGVNTLPISGTGVGAATPGSSKYDGTYDFFFKHPAPGGVTQSVNLLRFFIVRNGVVSSSDGALAGVVNGSGQVTFTGPCPINNSLGDWTGNMNASALAGSNFGQGTYTCRTAIGGSSNTWQVNQSR